MLAFHRSDLLVVAGSGDPVVDEPDVPKADWVAVVLDFCRQRVCAFADSFPASGWSWQVETLVNRDAVQPDGEVRVLNFLSVGIESRSTEPDVVGLP